MTTEFRVIRIIDENSIMIRGGTQDGLQEGAVLFMPYGDDFSVIDPETSEVLGTIKAGKLYVEVTTVFERFSICMNSEFRNQFDFTIQAISNFRGQRKELPVSLSEIQGAPWKPKPRAIKVGDIFTLDLSPSAQEAIGEGEQNT